MNHSVRAMCAGLVLLIASWLYPPLIIDLGEEKLIHFQPVFQCRFGAEYYLPLLMKIDLGIFVFTAGAMFDLRRKPHSR